MGVAATTGLAEFNPRRLLDELLEMSRTTIVRSKLEALTLGDLHDAARIIGDSGLAQGLKQLQDWVEGKCRGRKVKPGEKGAMPIRIATLHTTFLGAEADLIRNIHGVGEVDWTNRAWNFPVDTRFHVTTAAFGGKYEWEQGYPIE